MYKIGIAASADAHAIEWELQALFSSMPGKPVLSLVDDMDAGEYDILLIHEQSTVAAAADTVVLNSDESGPQSIVPGQARRLIITYGFNSKASITASSVFEGLCCICVQRAFTTPSGLMRENQELTIPSRNAPITLAALAVALVTDWDMGDF